MSSEYEEKIVEAINRNTEAVIKTGDTVLHRPSGEMWLVAYSENGYVCACGWPETLARESDCQLIESASEDMRIRLLHEIAGKGGDDSRRSYARRALGMAVALVLIFMPAIYSHAMPLLPPLDQPIIELGAPPLPPPNPNVQYWYTMDVPGPQGVLPVGVFAPRLIARVASEPQGVDVPEPGTGWLVGFVFIMAACVMVLKNIAVEGIREWELWAKRYERYRLALEDIAATCTDTEGLKRIARKALEESK